MALLFVGALSAVALSCRLGFSCFGDRLTAIRYALGLTVASRQNIAYGAKSTEFMAPPHFGFKLMREVKMDPGTPTASSKTETVEVAFGDDPK